MSPHFADPFPQLEPVSLLRKAFPNLDWLKQQVSLHAHWPTLIMNATASQSWRPDIRGPLTLFMNLRGTSHVGVDGYRAAVGEDLCFITNAGQHYSLEIDSPTPVETFNLHLGQELLQQIGQMVLAPERWLDGESAATEIGFPNRLLPRDEALQNWIRRVRSLEKQQAHAQELEAAMADLVAWLLMQQANVKAERARLPALRQGTRTEIHLRLNRARDCLYSSEQTVDLDALARIACLSKYHFLRLFKAAYGCTPHQFQLGLRMHRAGRLLARTPLSVQQIAWQLGFEDVSSFSRQFRSQIGVYPSQYRRQAS